VNKSDHCEVKRLGDALSAILNDIDTPLDILPSLFVQAMSVKYSHVSMQCAALRGDVHELIPQYALHNIL
jgi:hypothetical protein